MATSHAPPTPEEAAALGLAAPTPEEAKALGLDAPVAKEQPGMVESAARGAEQGALASFAPEVNAGLETAGGLVTGNVAPGGIISAYQKARDESQAAFDAAKEANPWTYGAGMLGGGVLGAAASGGSTLAEGGVLASANAAAKYGAISALGESKHDYAQDIKNATEGQEGSLGNLASAAGQAGKEIAEGGVAGGLLGAGTHFVGQGLKAAFGDEGLIGQLGPVQSLKNNWNSKLMVGANAALALGKQVTDLIDNRIGTELTGRINTLSAAKEALFNSDNSTINLEPWIDDVVDSLQSAKMVYGRSDPAAIQDVQLILSRIHGMVNGNPVEGILPTGTNMIPMDADMLRTTLRDLSAPGSFDNPGILKNNDIKEVLRRLISEESLSHGAGTSTNTAASTKLAEAADLLGNKPPTFDKYKNVLHTSDNFKPLDAMINDSRPPAPGQQGITEINKQLEGLIKSRKNPPSTLDLANYKGLSLSDARSRQNVIDFLDGLPADMRAAHEAEINSIASDAANMKSINRSSIDPNWSAKPFETTKGFVAGMTNVVGNATRAVGEQLGEAANTPIGKVVSPALTGVGRGFRDLYNMSTEQLSDLGNLIKDKVPLPGADQMYNILTQAGNKDRMGRNALFFAMQQNPAYRAIINHLTGDDNGQQ